MTARDAESLLRNFLTDISQNGPRTLVTQMVRFTEAVNVQHYALAPVRKLRGREISGDHLAAYRRDLGIDDLQGGPAVTYRPREIGHVSSAAAFEARNDLLWICDRWPDLKSRLRPGGGGSGDGIRTAPTSREPMNLGISDLMYDIATQAETLAHELMDETDDWQPTTSAMPTLLREVAERYGHFTAGADFTARSEPWTSATGHTTTAPR